jgi:uncharacterized protein YycO
MQVNTGDVLFVWGTDFIEHEIETITKGPSHVAFFINETHLIEAQGGRPIQIVPLSNYAGVHTEVYYDPSITNSDAAKMLDFAQSKIGLGYDYFLDLLELFHFELGARITWYHNNKHFICSTFVNAIGNAADKTWTIIKNPAPIDLLEGGKLLKRL